MALEMFEVHVYRQELSCDECGELMKADPDVGREAWMAYFYKCPKCNKRETHSDEFPKTLYVRRRRDRRD